MRSVAVFLLGNDKSFVNAFLVGNKEVYSCVFVEKLRSLLMCFWWKIKKFVYVFLMENE